jgi:hypothetical protein
VLSSQSQRAQCQSGVRRLPNQWLQHAASLDMNTLCLVLQSQAPSHATAVAGPAWSLTGCLCRRVDPADVEKVGDSFCLKGQPDAKVGGGASASTFCANAGACQHSPPGDSKRSWMRRRCWCQND